MCIVFGTDLSGYLQDIIPSLFTLIKEVCRKEMEESTDVEQTSPVIVGFLIFRSLKMRRSRGKM